ncbi:TIR domain-containing protein [Clostridium sp. SM-530-WT-3G]|uniref:TIR domain-containing protein n=1 Tax=Clostridium sp. SM-530-WT-3G TaxID=2725303 RepID=UPI00145C636D|nr:TIR domain-containing protein [Clostridium sp. SM-530-WT-3G]NME81855.1 TIR domain-containing protein [Clostridium sp. SM-530-WT-3G]
MSKKIQPLSIVFVWNPADNEIVKPILEYCSKLLSRDIKNPFSRAINLPIFYYTTLKKGVPESFDYLDSEKSIIFSFVSKNVIIDEEWKKYIHNLSKINNSIVIPIALDKYAFKIGAPTNLKNFIRFYEFTSNPIEKIFISITHEIYRYALNESFQEIAKGKENSLKLFLSHTKDGNRGVELAKKLKEFIDDSQMRNFFDATDIGTGYRFDEEISDNIKESSIIIIHSDTYSSRYWCQKEILTAKSEERPIIAVNVVENFEDRNFPFASNIPELRVKYNGGIVEEDLLRILSSAIVETIRFFYSKKLLNNYCDNSEDEIRIICRPPEVSDIEKVLSFDNGKINIVHKSILYPEPPVYLEEVTFLNNLGIKTYTPLTSDLNELTGMKIGISISEPSEEDMIKIGQNKSHLSILSQDIARYLIARRAHLIYGGDLRPNGFTEFLFNEAKILKNRLNDETYKLTNYIAWPIYTNDNEELKLWKAEYCDVAEMREVKYDSAVADLIINEDTFLPPKTAQNLYVWSRCLTKMRKEMIEECDVRICAGGRKRGYKGIMPGVLEEIIIAIENKRPLYLLGGFGGITSSVCDLIQNGIVSEDLTLNWQINNNSGYKELLSYATNRERRTSVDYEEIIEKIKKVDITRNGLSLEENYKLFTTPFVEEAVYLILKGLKNIKEN